MPKLRKQSEQQRLAAIRLSQRNNRIVKDRSSEIARGNLLRMTRRENISNSQRECLRDNHIRQLRRQNMEFSLQEQQRDSSSRQLRRQDEDYTQQEGERDSSSRQLRRQNDEYSYQEQQRDSSSRQLRRQDEDYTQQEGERDTSSRQLRRQNEEYSHQEQQMDSTSRQLRRQDEEYSQQEGQRDTSSRQLRRQNDEYSHQEQQMDSTSRQLRRQDEEYSQQEGQRDTSSRQLRRQNDEYSHLEEQRDSSSRQLRRQDEEYSQQEGQRDTSSRQLRRQNDDYSHQEQQMDSSSRQLRRQDEEYSQQECQRDSSSRQLRRRDEEHILRELLLDNTTRIIRRSGAEYRQQEQNADTLRRSQRRQNVAFREAERNRDQNEHAIRRRDPELRNVEQQRNTQDHRRRRAIMRSTLPGVRRMQSCRVQLHRMNTRRALELVSESQTADGVSSLKYNDYFKSVKLGPTEVCVCCGGTWFLSQTRKLHKEETLAKFNHPELFYLAERFPSTSGKYTFCNTCCNCVRQQKVPNICLENGLEFPHIPQQLQGLTPLEERLVSPRIPFMRIIALGCDRQSALRGAVVNIPIEFADTVRSLPRTFDQSHVIQVHLKRKMSYDHNYVTETIRPAKVLQAAQYLTSTALYRKHDIRADSDWAQSFNNEEVNFVASEEDQQIVRHMIAQHQSAQENTTDDSEETIINPGGLETLLDNEPIENIATDRIAMAPGEGRIPRDLTTDEDSEELSFPAIYCGQQRLCKEPYSKIARSEIRRYDRRCARVDKLLYTYKKYELLRIKNAISTCLRKKSGSTNYTACNMLDDTFVHNLVQHNEGYQILKGLRSAPSHWEKEKKKVLGMIRQFGLPTFFITLSAAESRWNELLVVLAKIIDEKTISEEEAQNMETTEKFRLIRSDPVTCSRYFDHRIRQLFKLFRKEGCIFDNHTVEKYYWRVEFQHRGSPHIHGMYWLRDAPKIDLQRPCTFPATVAFIDKYISTDANYTSLENFTAYQKHAHGRSCLREVRGKKVCRFNMPYPPMTETNILLPLSDEDESDIHHKNFENIQHLINAKVSQEEESRLNDFQSFLSHDQIGLSYDDYILAIRSSLKNPRVFYKRKFKDRFVNCFNPTILGLHRANMDIQFILDAYACCSYIINYINKSNRGVSRLMRETMDEINGGNLSVRQKFQRIGNKFINATEISAQEAAYNILGLHLSEASNADVYVDTNIPQNRVRMIKSKANLQNMSPDDTNIYVPNLLDHYTQRPDCLEQLCLADFAAKYRFSKTWNGVEIRDNDFEEIIEEPEIPLLCSRIPLKDKSGYVFKRTKPCVLRYRRFNMDSNRTDYFRELVMLFMPWRNEELEVLSRDCESICRTQTSLIEQNRREYDQYEEHELENILQRVQAEQGEEEHTRNDVQDDPQFQVLAVPEIDPNVDVFHVGNGNTENTTTDDDSSVRVIKLPSPITDAELKDLISTLNEKQRIYYNHIRNQLNQDQPFYEFVSGGAGVGKSRLIKVIYHALVKQFTNMPGCDPNLPRVLLCAPTGKAAFGIGGATLHSLFSLPVNQHSGALKSLSNDVCNKIYSYMMQLKLIIIDEISMVGSKMFSFLDLRLKQIFKTNQAFGGIPIIVFGDLRQLSPVGDKWIFSPNTSDPYCTIIGVRLWDLFKYFQLTEIMRQRNDVPFAEALNNMAAGNMTEDNVKLIRSRMRSNISEVPQDAIHLFYSNKSVDEFNEYKLGIINGEVSTSEAYDVIRANSLTENNSRRILEAAKKFKTSETQGLPHSLILKESAKYMVTVNIDTNDGLVNGATGILREINYNGSRPSTVWIEFPEQCVGAVLRSKQSHPTHPHWTPIHLIVKAFQYRRNEHVMIHRKQFPIVPAEGITIHKSQGATYSKVAVHISPRISRSALYVACSRATSASGLYIVGNFIPPKPVLQTDPVQQEIVKLQQKQIIE